MPKMAKNHQIEGSNSGINGSSGGLFEGGGFIRGGLIKGEAYSRGGGLLKIFSSRVGACSKGAFLRGVAIRGFTVV